MKNKTHYSPKFLKAYAKVEAALAETGGEYTDDVKRLFRDEMLKLGHVERVKNLYRVKGKLSGRAEFLKLNAAQAEYLATKKGRDIILKTRQLGFTTLSGVRALDLALWEENATTGIMAHLQNLVTTIFEDIVKFTWDWFKTDWGHLYSPTEDSDSRTALSFSDDGLGRPLNSSMRVMFNFRGKTIRFLHVSEAAFIADERLLGSLNGVPATGEVVLESTPNGKGGDFYTQWQNWKTLGPLAPYKGHFFPWFKHYPELPDNYELPENAELEPYEKTLKEECGLQSYHIAWRRWCIAANCQGNAEKFENEYPSNDIDCFYTGESQVFPSSLLKQLDKNARPPAKIGFLLSDGPRTVFHADPKGITFLWEEPKPGVDYVIGADPANGVGRDRSVAYVKNRANRRLVAKVEGQIEASEFAEELVKLGNYFNRAFICPEENNHGHVVIQGLKTLKYPNVYKRKVIDEMTNKPTKKLGFLTNNASKILITDLFKKACAGGDVVPLDQGLIDEMSTFIQVSSPNGLSVRREAASGKHDDRVMAAVLCEEMCRNRGEVVENEISEATVVEGASHDDETGFSW